MATKTRTIAGVDVDFERIQHAFVEGDTVTRAIDKITLHIPKSQFIALTGPSGCGKTTMLGMAAGLIKPSKGQVYFTVDGEQSTKANTAYMLARDALFPWDTVSHNVELGLKIRGVAKAERHQLAIEWLSKVGLSGFEDSSIFGLSQGMRQRVAIARTLVLNPQCILMDEPFAALDAQTRLMMQREFLALWESQKTTVLFVTHDLNEAILLADRIVMLSQRPGQIVEDLTVTLPRPRDPLATPESTEFRQIYHVLSARLREQLIDSDRAARPNKH